MCWGKGRTQGSRGQQRSEKRDGDQHAMRPCDATDSASYPQLTRHKFSYVSASVSYPRQSVFSAAINWVLIWIRE
jgi:hypothetical protein